MTSTLWKGPKRSEENFCAVVAPTSSLLHTSVPGRRCHFTMAAFIAGDVEGMGELNATYSPRPLARLRVSQATSGCAHFMRDRSDYKFTILFIAPMFSLLSFSVLAYHFVSTDVNWWITNPKSFNKILVLLLPRILTVVVHLDCPREIPRR